MNRIGERESSLMKKCDQACSILIVFVLTWTGFVFGENPVEVVHWQLDNVESIAGYPTTILGDPQVIDAPAGNAGKAVWFDGLDDGLIVNANPLAGADSAFTVEVIFRPDSSFPNNEEQRFVHIQNPSNDNRRILIETRLTADHQWYLDTFIKSELSSETLLSPTLIHPVGEWYHAALVYQNGSMRHYINGIEELSGQVDFLPIEGGETSLGVRMNQKSWFRGAIQTLIVTHCGLSPEEFTPFITPIQTAEIFADGYFLYPNYPNPFNQGTQIIFTLPKSEWTSLKVFNLRGQRVKTLVNDYLEKGTYRVMVDASDLASGTYFYQIQSVKFIKMRRMNLIK